MASPPSCSRSHAGAPHCSAEEHAGAMQESPGRMGLLQLLLSMPAACVSSYADATTMGLSVTTGASVTSGASVMAGISSSMVGVVSAMVASC